MDTLNVWAGACSHVGTDLQEGRESFAEAIRQSEGFVDGAPEFEWDVMLHLGDISGTQTPPDDEEGREIRRQWSALRENRREQIYNVLGNHDGSGPVVSGEDRDVQWWFRKWVDPTGEHSDVSGVDPDQRPFPIDGTWERYAFEAGNVLFLLMGDRNDGGPPAGRAYREEGGGYPAGKVTRDTFEWWREQVEANQDKIIVTSHHHMLKDTTVASGPWEGIVGNYHGHMADGAPEGASYLYFIGDDPDANAFESYLTENPGAIDLWLGGHTHARPGDRYGGKSHVERKWDVTFANVAPMTKYHVQAKSAPLTRLITFEPGKSLAEMRCYLHTDDLAPVGWYEEAHRRIPLRHSFSGLEE
ncbi:metallophosphoesterase [Halovenus marina]|uniref:metallophosphoesterase n=1 Tax=Halovenus marina TaxID=3396621 RepID=UPI003F555BCA